MTAVANPRGYFERFLVVDVETSGFAKADDASYDPGRDQTFQTVAIGLIVVNAQTLKTIEELYVEIKWDGVSTWSMGAQNVHGLTLDYLEEHGVSSADAALAVANLILDHWGPNSPVVLCGHNVVSFDIWFVKRLLRSAGFEVIFSNRTIDTNALGFAVFSMFNSDDVFEQVGCAVRDGSKHNALDDARMSLQVVRTARTIADTVFGE
jgi:DNA polymerase III epsilon subunit-like protein